MGTRDLFHRRLAVRCVRSRASNCVATTLADGLPVVAVQPGRTGNSLIIARHFHRIYRPNNRLQRTVRKGSAAEPERWAPEASANATIPPMIDWSTCEAVERDPERVSGAWVFRGTRVPVAALFENLEDGVQVGQFAELFPGVTLEQSRAVLEHAARSALAAA